MDLNSKTPRHGPRVLAMFFAVVAVVSCGESPPPAEGEAGGGNVGVIREAVGCASGTLGGKTVYAHFNNPPAFNGVDNTITDEVKRLIRETPPGAHIRGAIHSLNMLDVAQELRAASDRGVIVRLVLDGKNDVSTEPINLIRPFSVFCHNAAGAGSCISTSASGNMHTKMFTFSQTKDPAGNVAYYVSWISSANLTGGTGGTGPGAFNNAVSIYGADTLYNSLNVNFDDMWYQRRYAYNDYYDSASGRGYYMTNPADVYASPEAAGQTDTIVTRLNDITPDSSCEIRIGMAFVTTGRPALLQQIKNMSGSGRCRVMMLVGQKDDGTINMAPTVRSSLEASGVVIRKRLKVHDKFFAVYGKYGASYQYRVYTGSQNWSQDALSENEELFVKLAGETGTTHPIYDGFVTHFHDGFDTATACVPGNPC